jgi:hypothetical protein
MVVQTVETCIGWLLDIVFNVCSVISKNQQHLMMEESAETCSVM